MSLRNLMAADVFSLGASLYERETGKEPARSGPGWQQLRDHPDEITAKVVAATDSRPLARIVQLCITRDPGQRATAAALSAAMATMFADVSPEMTSRQQMNARVGAFKANNKRLNEPNPG
jgi:serine/threonine protein kinase